MLDALLVKSIDIEDDQSNMDDVKSLKSFKSYKSRGSFRSELNLANSKNFDDEDPDIGGGGEQRARRGHHAGAVSHASHRIVGLDEDIIEG